MQRRWLVTAGLALPLVFSASAATAQTTEELSATELPATKRPATELPATERPSFGYKRGFFISSTDKRFKLVIQTRVQGRFAIEREKTANAMAESPEVSSAFSIPRARLTLKGHAFAKEIHYKFQTDFGKGGASLKDFFVDYKIGTPIIRVGQFKRPFSRQQITSSGRQEFVDRAITNKAFGAGRDIGIAIHNNYEKSPEIEWVVGLFNGTGDKSVLKAAVDPVTGDVTGKFSNVPADIQPALVARGGYNSGGIKGYSEADFEGGPLRFAVGGSLIAVFDNDGDDKSGITGEIDALVKNNGLTGSAGLYLATEQDGGGFSDQSYSQVGGHVQAGYLISGNIQPAVRYALVSRDGEDANHEVTLAISVYRFAHGFKWQSDVSLLGTSAGIADHVRARAQLQLSF